MKKLGFLTLLILATVLVMLAFSTAMARPVPPRHPHVTAAIEAMRNAKGHMEQAEGEFHGHRAKAIEHLNAAITEAEVCEREP